MGKVLERGGKWDGDGNGNGTGTGTVEYHASEMKVILVKYAGNFLALLRVLLPCLSNIGSVIIQAVM